jgi:hypothetical protein
LSLQNAIQREFKFRQPQSSGISRHPRPGRSEPLVLASQPSFSLVALTGAGDGLLGVKKFNNLLISSSINWA